jgi:hypothetical protein
MALQTKPDPAANGVIWHPETDAECQQVRRQLDRLTASAGFNQSRRYTKLLRYIVEETLGGRAERLKERTIGVDVFEREPAYDSNADPVVRSTAAQLRRRVAQYYSQQEHQGELLIYLPPGSYAAEFRLPASPADARNTQPFTVEEVAGGREHPDEDTAALVLPLHPSVHSAQRFSRKQIFTFGTAALILLFSAVALFLMRGSTAGQPQTAIDAFWGPIWNNSEYITLVVGHATGDPDNLPKPSSEVTIYDSLVANRVPWPDAIALSSLVSVAASHDKKYRLQRASLTPLADLRNAPAILIGGFNNSWIMRLGASLRFRLRLDREPRTGFIEDVQRPAFRNWQTKFDAPFSSFDQDFGVITRVTDPLTERPVVIACGIASYGTIAAGEFLSTEKYMHMFVERAPKGWQRKNVQVVFSTKVINGNSGPPRILATYFW